MYDYVFVPEQAATELQRRGIARPPLVLPPGHQHLGHGGPVALLCARRLNLSQSFQEDARIAEPSYEPSPPLPGPHQSTH